MTGPERQVLRLVKKLRDTDTETIAKAMCVSADYVTQLCEVLIGDDLLRRGPGGYSVTPKGLRIQVTSGQNRMQRARNVEVSDAISRGVDLAGNEKRYCIGEIIGEIKMKPDLPSPEQVEATLRSNPQSSYEEIEARLTSHTLICPAKDKEATWHYCSACPHQKGIDFQNWVVQCSYGFNERRLDMVYGKEEIKALAGDGKGEFTDLDIEERIGLPHVRCPLLGSVIAVDRCTDCRYQRGGQWHHKSQKTGIVGWVLCGAPPSIEKRNDDGRTSTYNGKKIRVVPPRWR